jgi:hypothetical protein
MRTIKQTPNQRRKNLKNLLSDAIRFNYSKFLIDNYTNQLNEVENEINQEKERIKARKEKEVLKNE